MTYVSNMKKALFGSLLVAAVTVFTTGCTASASPESGAKCGGDKSGKCGAGKCGGEKSVSKCGGN